MILLGIFAYWLVSFQGNDFNVSPFIIFLCIILMGEFFLISWYLRRDNASKNFNWWLMAFKMFIARENENHGSDTNNLSFNLLGAAGILYGGSKHFLEVGVGFTYFLVLLTGLSFLPMVTVSRVWRVWSLELLQCLYAILKKELLLETHFGLDYQLVMRFCMKHFK